MSITVMYHTNKRNALSCPIQDFCASLFSVAWDSVFVPILSIHLLVHTARREDEQPATYGATKVTN